MFNFGFKKNNNTIPKNGLIFKALLKNGLVDSIGLSTITIVSGTTWADWVVTLQATPALLAADTGHIFFTAADVPKQVRLSTLFENNLGYAFAGNGILVIYSSPQSAQNIVRIERYIRTVTAFGGYFTFDATAPASVSFRIDTVGGVPWILNGAYVASGIFTAVNKDITRNISIGVSAPDIVSIFFYNADWSAYTGIAFSLSDLSAMRPTVNLYLYSMPLVTGSLSDLSAMRPTGTLYLYSMPLVTGSFSDLSAMRPTGSLYLYSMPLVTNCGVGNLLFSLSKNINVTGCGLTQGSVDNILAAIVTGAKTNGTIQMQGGTNSTPSAAGIISKNTLLSRGWTVTTN